jgi:hypothetical protein
MSRALPTKGKTIGIRLPLALDAAVRTLAERKGMTPGTYVADWIVRSYAAKTAAEVNRPGSNVRSLHREQVVPIPKK